MRCTLSQIWQKNYGEWIPCHPDDPLFIQYNMIQNEEVELCEIQSLLFPCSLVCRTIDLGTGYKRADSRHDFFPFIHFLSATQDFFFCSVSLVMSAKTFIKQGNVHAVFWMNFRPCDILCGLNSITCSVMCVWIFNAYIGVFKVEFILCNDLKLSNRVSVQLNDWFISFTLYYYSIIVQKQQQTH